MGGKCLPCEEKANVLGFGTLDCGCVVTNKDRHKITKWCLDGGSEANGYRHLMLYARVYMRKLLEGGAVDEDDAVLAVLAWVYWTPSVFRIETAAKQPGTWYAKFVAAAEARGLPAVPLKDLQAEYREYMRSLSNGNGSGTPAALKTEVRSERG